MLYNPHHRVPSLESFAAWLETKIQMRNIAGLIAVIALAPSMRRIARRLPSGRGMDDILISRHGMN